MQATLAPPVDSPRALSIMTTGTSASAADKTGHTWSVSVTEDNCWEDLILTLGTYVRPFGICVCASPRRCFRKAYTHRTLLRRIHRRVHQIHDAVGAEAIPEAAVGEWSRLGRARGHGQMSEMPGDRSGILR